MREKLMEGQLLVSGPLEGKNIPCIHEIMLMLIYERSHECNKTLMQAEVKHLSRNAIMLYHFSSRYFAVYVIYKKNYYFLQYM